MATGRFVEVDTFVGAKHAFLQKHWCFTPELRTKVDLWPHF